MTSYPSYLNFFYLKWKYLKLLFKILFLFKMKKVKSPCVMGIRVLGKKINKNCVIGIRVCWKQSLWACIQLQILLCHKLSVALLNNWEAELLTVAQTWHPLERERDHTHTHTLCFMHRLTHTLNSKLFIEFKNVDLGRIHI